MDNRIFIYPYNQYSESATAVARALGCQKLLRVNSRYVAREGDVIVNWGASDCPYPNALNAKLSAIIDKREFFKRTADSDYVPQYLIVKRGEDRVMKARNAFLAFPVLCRTKVKGHDGEGIVIAENHDELVDAPLYVSLMPKTAEYRVHVTRRDGDVKIIGVQQKFLPQNKADKDLRIRTTANGCYFVWTVDGAPVSLPPKAALAVMDVFKRFPELTFGGFDVIYNKPDNSAYVIEINSAPELTEKAAAMYAEFFEGFRRPKPEPVVPIVVPDDVPFGGDQMVVPMFGAQGMVKVALDPNPIDNEDDAKAVAAMNAVIEAQQELGRQIDYGFWLGAEPEEQVVEVKPEPEPKESAYLDYCKARERFPDAFERAAFYEGWKARKEMDYAAIFNA